MKNIPPELMFEMIERIDIFDLDTICKMDTTWRNFCKKNNTKIIKIFLKKHNIKINENDDSTLQLKRMFKILFRQLKEDKFYKDEFPKIVIQILSITANKTLDKNIIKTFLKRDYTKYEYIVINEALKRYQYQHQHPPSTNDIKNLINYHIYRYGKRALGNPFNM